MNMRREWIDREGELAVSRQCELTGVARSWVYSRSKGDVPTALDLTLLRMIDAEYTRRPFYGSRRIAEICERSIPFWKAASAFEKSCNSRCA